MRKLKWVTSQKTVNELVPQVVNPRKISDKQMSDLKKSLEKYNLVEIPVSDIDGKILAGHQRIKALQLLGRGEEIIDVRIPNRKLTEKESKQYLIASNKLGGDWDFELLAEFDFKLLNDSGFEDFEIAEFWDKEKELKKIKETNIKLGDIIHLSNHKILCGDSTDKKNLKRLLRDERASMIYSDPIYNINIDYNGGISGNKSYGGNVNDNRSEKEYYQFITKAIKASLGVSKEDVHLFYFCDQIYIGFIQDIYRKHGISNKRVALWIKNNQNPVHTVAFNKAYEPCVYGTRGKPYLNISQTKYHEIMNKELGTGNELLEQLDKQFIDIWTCKRLASKNYQHSTSKPISLHEQAIKRCTRRNDIIIDSFLGSGSTLLAAEQLGRRVYGCELEPIFCQLIVDRFEKMTGTKVIIESYEKTRS